MGAPEAVERTGVLVVRVWIERPPGTGLRARITAQGLDDGEQTTTAASTVDTILEVVRHWLEAFVSAAT
jgi:hypothetical protein